MGSALAPGVAYGGAVIVLVCDFSECPFELMSYCDESAAMRCPDCPFARCVPDDPAALNPQSSAPPDDLENLA